MLNGQDIQAFPPGFQMISGDTFRRNSTLPSSSNPDAPDPNSLHPDDTSQSALRQKALGFNCLHYQSTPEGSLQRHGLPSKEYLDTNCNDGIRLELMFPSCWNGKDADSPDHQSHVAFPDGVMAGTCPQGFDKRLPSMFYETIFDTSAFKGKAGQFVISNGDPTGYGYHGDFVSLMGTKQFNFTDRVLDCRMGSIVPTKCHQQMHKPLRKDSRLCTIYNSRPVRRRQVQIPSTKTDCQNQLLRY